MAPFPYRPMVAILASLICQMMVQFGIFSYVGYMVQHLGVVDDKDKAGYYAGVLSSGFMIGRFLTAYFWGWFADRYGRRNVILAGLSSTAILSVAFGLSQTFWWAFLCRFLLGASDGVVTVAKVLVSEICGKEHEIVGMGALTTAWSFGLVMGTGLGGILAEPATNFPSVFSESGIFGRFPYLLPSISVSCFGLVALPLVLLFVPGDTNPADKSNRENAESSDELSATNVESDTPVKHLSESSRLRLDYVGHYDGHSASRHQNEDLPALDMTAENLTQQIRPKAPSSALVYEAVPLYPTGAKGGLPHGSTAPAGLLQQSNVRLFLLINGMYTFLFSGFDEVFSLWALSTVSSGGLDWSTQRIGQAILTAGVILFLFEIVSVPCITARLGIKWCQRLASLLEVPAYVLFPMLARLRGKGLVKAAAFALLFSIYVCSNWMTIAVNLAINNSTDRAHRGEVNGLATAVSSVGKAVGPAAFSALFAFSIDGEHPFPLDFHLAWYTVAIVRLLIGLLAWNTIRDGKGYEERMVDALE